MLPTQLIGTRAQVLRGIALKTAYGKKGLRKNQLRKNKYGKIVSIRAPRTKTAGTLKKWMKSEGLLKKSKFGLLPGKKKTLNRSKSRKWKGLFEEAERGRIAALVARDELTASSAVLQETVAALRVELERATSV